MDNGEQQQFAPLQFQAVPHHIVLDAERLYLHVQWEDNSSWMSLFRYMIFRPTRSGIR